MSSKKKEEKEYKDSVFSILFESFNILPSLKISE